MQLCALGSRRWVRKFHRASNKHRRHLACSLKQKSRSGGRSSRRRTSRASEMTEQIMKLPRRKFLRLTAGAVALPALPHIAKAQAYPSRPVRIVVAGTPGGANDVLARLVAPWLSERLGQQFVAENRAGGSGNIGTETVVRAPPDGYTLLLVDTQPMINSTLYEKLNYNFIRDIVPIAGISRFPYVLVVNPSVPVKTVPDLIAYAKANPGKINVGSPGIGTGLHVAGELFK